MNRASKFGKKSSPSMMEPKRKASSRNPLKEINSSGSSNSSSLSVEAPKGCLRFFLSNSTSSRTPIHRPKSLPKTPKSAPNPRPSNPISKTIKPTKSILENPILKHKPKAKKTITPCLYQWQNGKKLSSRQPQELKPLTCGSEEHVEEQKHLNTIDTGKSYELRLSCSNELRLSCSNENGTPLHNLANGCGLDSTPEKVMDEISITTTTTTTTTTPPIQASVSPEIQCGSSLVSTPACFGAGHIVSGVTDNRKCRPKGILTIGENDLGFCKTRIFDGFDNAVNDSAVSPFPPPNEASVRWFLPACAEEEKEDKKNNSGNNSPEFRRFVGLTELRSPSSPSSGHGFSSNVCNSSTSTKRTPLVSPIRPPEFQGVLGTTSTLHQIELSCDHVNGLQASSSPTATSNCKTVSSQVERRYHRYDIASENSPLSLDSLSSGNVVVTPQSDSSSADRWFSISSLNAVDHHQEHNIGYDYSMAEALRNTSLSSNSQISAWDPADVLPLPGFSFQFPHLISTPSDSIDLTQLQNTLDDWTSPIPRYTFENASVSQLRISWREGLPSRIFEMDELDCCRWLSDDEEDVLGCCGNDQFISDLCREVDDGNVKNDQTLTGGFGSSEILCKGPGTDETSKLKLPPPQAPPSCAESISTEGGGGLVASEDSDWTLCYKNQLFEM